MKELNQQIFELVESAPRQGIPKPAMAAISQRLAQVAQELGQLDFYLLQDSQGGWWSPEMAIEDHQSEKKWVVVFSNRAHANTTSQQLNSLADTTPPAETASSSTSTHFSVTHQDVMPLLMLGLGLRNSAGLAIYRQTLEIRPASGWPAPDHLIPTSTLQQLMQGALVDLKSQLKQSSTLA